MADGKRLTTRQQKALDVLLVGGTDQQAADAAGVSRQSISDWRNKLPTFVEALTLARTELLKRTTSRLHASTTVAVRALEEVAKGDVSRGGAARVAAARAIIEFSQRAIELEELERRLTELETALEQQENDRR